MKLGLSGVLAPKSDSSNLHNAAVLCWGFDRRVMGLDILAGASQHKADALASPISSSPAMNRLGCGVLEKTQEYRIVCLSAGSNPASRAKRMGLGRGVFPENVMSGGRSSQVRIGSTGYAMQIPSPARSGNE